MISVKTIANKVQKDLYSGGIIANVWITDSQHELCIQANHSECIMFPLKQYATVAEAQQNICKEFRIKYEAGFTKVDKLSCVLPVLKPGGNDYLNYSVIPCADGVALNSTDYNITDKELLQIAKKNLLQLTHFCAGLKGLTKFYQGKEITTPIDNFQNASYLWLESSEDCSGLLLLHGLFGMLAHAKESDLIIIPVKHGLIIDSVRAFIDYNKRRSQKTNERLKQIVYNIKSELDVDELHGALAFVYLYNKTTGDLNAL